MANARPTTLVLSDLHLTTVEPLDPERPMWRRYKQRDLLYDDRLAAMLEDARHQVRGPFEVVFNGDIFDFDAVTDLPDPAMGLHPSYMERIRGLAPTEAKSLFKLSRILADHPVFVAAVQRLTLSGARVVFVVGNHDLELLWPSVQAALERTMTPDGAPGEVRVVEWFYRSGDDTLIEHGHQYDSYCLCDDPLWPTIRLTEDGPARIRLPFGSYASRVLVNGMGVINPHNDQTWLLSFAGYALYFWNHVVRVQPLLPLTWMWSSVVTLLLSVRDGFLPAQVDPRALEERVDEVAGRAQATPAMVRALYALRVHPAFYTPWRIAQELWVDRLVLFLLVVVGSFQAMATLNVLFGWGLQVWLTTLILLFPPFLLYAQGIEPEARAVDRAVAARATLVAGVANVERWVLGHTHVARHTDVGPLELLNPGTWSPGFRDAACTEPVGHPYVVWIRPVADGSRAAAVEAWLDPGWLTLPRAQADEAPEQRLPFFNWRSRPRRR